MHPKYLTSGLVALTLIFSIQSHPLESDDEVEIELAPPTQSNPLRLKQEDTDDDEVTTAAYQFGSQVAQIIKGAVTGDLSSILQGSFNLVPNVNTAQEINNAWGTISGQPKTAPTIATTTAAPTEAPRAPETTEAAPEPLVVEVTQESSTTEAESEPSTTDAEVESETEETKAEDVSTTEEETSTIVATSTSSSNNEDDDDEDAEELNEKNINEALEDNSVFTRSKVLRVV